MTNVTGAASNGEPLEPLASTTESYDRIAGTYADNHVEAIGEQVERTRARFAERLRVGAIVGDVGCGPGRDVRWFADRGMRAVGVDSSLEMLRLPTQRGSLRLQADLRRLPFAAGSLDGLWCASTLLHVPRDEASGVLAGFRRVLRRGGLLAITTPVGDAEGWELVPYDAKSQPYDGDVRRWFTYFRPSELTGLLCSAGFEIQHEETVERFKTWWHAVLRTV